LSFLTAEGCEPFAMLATTSRSFPGQSRIAPDGKPRPGPFVEHDGDPLLAYIGIMRALNAGKPAPEPEPRSKAVAKHRVIR
jgi:hypothetical protein